MKFDLTVANEVIHQKKGMRQSDGDRISGETYAYYLGNKDIFKNCRYNAREL